MPKRCAYRPWKSRVSWLAREAKKLGRAVEVHGGRRAARHQHVLVHQGAQPQTARVEAVRGERPVEAHRVAAHEEQQHRVRVGAFDAPQHRLEVVGAQREVHLAADPAAGLAGIRVRRTGRPARPDVVVADHEPAAHPALVRQQHHRGAQLVARCLAGEEHPRRVLTALVQRRVDVRHPVGDPRREGLADGGDVPARDALYDTEVHQGLDLLGDLARRSPAVDRHQPQLPAQRPARPVDLLDRQPRAQFARRAEDPRRPLHREDQRHAEDGVVGREPVGGGGIVPEHAVMLPRPPGELQPVSYDVRTS